ncbi:MAG: hypothetical protein NC898_05725 [Candidatus Omnitrophica bacterium]|nr:hypothetical protein [Candidatus Omnitrophota bacterium]MCM8793941.1 hypothetical protein [Candidatus Omnitrophota bacterium]
MLKIFILPLLNFLFIVIEPASVRRIKENRIFSPPGFVQEIVLKQEEILDSSLKKFLSKKAEEIVSQFQQGRLNIEGIESQIKGITYTRELAEKTLSLTNKEIEQRRNFEEVSEDEEKDLYFWMIKIVYTLASRELVSLIISEIEDEELQERLAKNFLDIHYGGGEGLISDDFYLAIKLITEYGDLVPKSFLSLFNREGINNDNILSVWVKVPAQRVSTQPLKATYQYRVTVKRGEEIISAEFILKVSLGEEAEREVLKSILREIKKYSIDFPQFNSPGDWVENFVWEDGKQNYFLAFTQKSLLRDYIQSLAKIREILSEHPHLIIELEKDILTTALKFWKETRKGTKGLLVSLSPGDISLFFKKGKWEHRFVGIEKSSWLTWEEVIREMNKYGYSPEAISGAMREN